MRQHAQAESISKRGSFNHSDISPLRNNELRVVGNGLSHTPSNSRWVPRSCSPQRAYCGWRMPNCKIVSDLRMSSDQLRRSPVPRMG